VALQLLDSVRDVVIDPATSTATVPAGVNLDELLRVLVPRGFFVPVSPGTRFVTVGGAIASDIHGKNHHVDGSFGNHVHRLSLLLADGSTVELAPDRGAELFWATIGGMGLTGVILEATINVLPIETSRCSVDTDRVANLDEVLALMDEGDRYYRYSVAWIDLLAKGARLGRGLLTRGDHATADQLRPRDAVDPLVYAPRQRIAVPPIVPASGVLNHLSIAAFNELWFRKAPRRRVAEIVSIPAYFHPLDFVGSWNRLYGRHGFLQYQFVVPFGQEDALRTVIERLASSGTASFLAVLKRFGAANPAPLSFPTPGWTLALDIPAWSHGLPDLLHGLDDVVLEAGGRHYLAKDAHMSPAAIRRGYPRLAEWQATRAAADPAGVWASDQSRRLRLLED
jgi:decaprenylphospho-beta-D-ribofuranose 2-oxidase